MPSRLPMLSLRVLAFVGVIAALGLWGWQVYRVIDEQPRSATITGLSLAAGAIGCAAIVVWTWCVVENARRLLEPAKTQELPRPWRAVATWVLPMLYVVAAVAVVGYLSRRLHTPVEGTSSPVPLIVAVGALLVALPITYHPLSYLAWVARRLGGASIPILRWFWVPVVLGAVGVLSVAGLRALGAFDDADDVIAPPWVIGVIAIGPCVVLVALGWRASSSMEDAVDLAFSRRRGQVEARVHRRSVLHRGVDALFGNERPRTGRADLRGHVRQVAGVGLLRLTVVTLIAGLALLTVVGAAVMFLFWREANDGVLLQSQSDRAWDVLDMLQTAERILALALLVMATLWTFVAVLNVRLASGRRRNPLLAALAWPAAGAAIWIIGERMVDSGSGGRTLAGFAAQAAVLYVPFFFLERASAAVGARRTPFRITYVFGVVLLVHVEGLGGLSTIAEVADADRFGRLAGYLALGALVQLLSTLAVTEACQSLETATAHEAEHHNFLVDQRTHAASTGSPLHPDVAPPQFITD